MSLTSVHKVNLVLPAGSYDEASKYQASARHWSRHRLPELLERHMAELAEDDEVIYIEKVVIELSDLPWNLSDAAWQQKLAEAIQVDGTATDPFEIIVRQWLFYLEHGCLEQDALLGNQQAIERYLLKRADKLAHVLERELREAASMSTWQRLFAQHQPPLVELFMTTMLAIESREAVRLYERLKPAIRIDPGTVFRLLRVLESGNAIVSTDEKRALLDQLMRTKPGDLEGIQKIGSSIKEAAANTPANKLPDTTIACTHAGLVLLFPYIKRYFENCRLVESDAFVDERARWTAVQALYFLATGETAALRSGGTDGAGDTEEVIDGKGYTGAVEVRDEMGMIDNEGKDRARDTKVAAVPEAALVLPKLLCGVELSTFVEWRDELPEHLQKEGIELLQAVIDHWKVLQNTSIDGLRETFLRRAGRLSKKEDTYTLQVEESGVDILLNRIPWGFRNYRLPWMPGHLITEWY